MRGNVKKDMENPLQHPVVSRSNICSLAVHVLDILEQLYTDAFVLKIVLLSHGERDKGTAADTSTVVFRCAARSVQIDSQGRTQVTYQAMGPLQY